jgi:hypothetical protein
MRRRFAALVLAVTTLVLGAIAMAGPVGADNQGDGIPAVPVHGRDVGNGVRLYVDVFYAGRHGGGGSGGGGLVDCTDNNDNSQSDYAPPFAFASNTKLTLHLNTSTVPFGLNVVGSLQAAEAAWNGAGSGTQLDFATDGTETSPAQNTVSTIGWVKIAPKNVLAATWTWVDSSNHITEADLFFNTLNPWATLGPCIQGTTTATGRFDVGDIATHEMGHVLGLSHFSDAGAQVTMYPSAPPDEVRKTTLTNGDIAALAVSVSG